MKDNPEVIIELDKEIWDMLEEASQVSGIPEEKIVNKGIISEVKEIKRRFQND